MPKVTLREAKANLATLIEKAHSGEEVIIVKDDKPLAKLVALPGEAKPRKRRIGGAKGIIKYMAEDFNAPLEDYQ